MILEEGDELVSSITYMFREISLTQRIPNHGNPRDSIDKKGLLCNTLFYVPIDKSKS